MAELQGVIVNKLQGQLGLANAGADNHFAMIFPGLPSGVVASAINNDGAGVVLKSVLDAEELGINQAYDTNNSVVLYRETAEFFRLAPEGTLYLFNSDTAADVRDFLLKNPDIKGYAIGGVWNDESPNLVSTLESQSDLVSELAAQNRLIDFAVVCLDGLDAFTENLFTQTAPNVSVCVACQYDDGKVSMGSLLGMLAVRKVNENLGSVNIENKPFAKRGSENYSLTDALLGKWTDAFLTDGRAVRDLSDSGLNAITSKGYILAASYQGYPGFYFENSYTAIERTSDFAYIENNRVWNKAARIIRATLLPHVKSNVKKDPTTGFIATTTVSRWEQLSKKALELMVIEEECSGFDVKINPNQVVSSTTSVKVGAVVVLNGIAHSFEVNLGLTNNL